MISAGADGETSCRFSFCKKLPAGKLFSRWAVYLSACFGMDARPFSLCGNLCFHLDGHLRRLFFTFHFTVGVSVPRHRSIYHPSSLCARSACGTACRRKRRFLARSRRPICCGGCQTLLRWITSKTRASSSAGICPGAELSPMVPKVAQEPKISPASRLTVPVPPMDMVRRGRSA